MKYFILLIFLSSVHPFTASSDLTDDMSGKLPVDIFNLFYIRKKINLYRDS